MGKKKIIKGLALTILFTTGISVAVYFFFYRLPLSEQQPTEQRAEVMASPSPKPEVKETVTVKPEATLPKTDINSIPKRIDRKQNISLENKGTPLKLQEDEGIEAEYQLNKFFEAEALETFPLYTVQTHNPKDPKSFGPPKGEVWIRIKPGNVRSMKEIMGEVADLYRQNAADAGNDITVMHWVGGQPWAKEKYSGREYSN